MAALAQAPLDSLKRCVGLPKGNRTGHRSWPGPNSVTIIAALHDPLTIFLANDLADMVTPDDDCTDRGSASVRSVMRPRPCEIVRRARVAADLPAHKPSAPRARPTCIMVAVAVMSRSSFCARSNEA